MSLQQRNTKTTVISEKGQDQVTLLKNEPQKLTLGWNEIPAWMQDNVYITAGYRPQLNSYWECIKSLGYLHNESGKRNQVANKLRKFISNVYSQYLESLVDIYIVCWIGNSLFIIYTVRKLFNDI